MPCVDGVPPSTAMAFGKTALVPENVADSVLAPPA